MSSARCSSDEFERLFFRKSNNKREPSMGTFGVCDDNIESFASPQAFVIVSLRGRHVNDGRSGLNCN